VRAAFGNGTSFGVGLVGEAGPRGLASNFTAFLGTPLPSLLFRLSAQRLGGSGLVAFAP
jgi:hypothetical protein